MGVGFRFTSGALWLAQSFVDVLPEFLSKGEALVIGVSLLTGTMTNFMCDGAAVAALEPAVLPMATLAEVILLTGHASVENSIDKMKLGAIDCHYKPVEFEDPREKISETFRKKATHEKNIRKAKIKGLLRFPGRVFDQDKEEL